MCRGDILAAGFCLLMRLREQPSSLIDIRPRIPDMPVDGSPEAARGDLRGTI
jgi:hypothetical protein